MIPWTCLTCGRLATIGKEDRTVESVGLSTRTGQAEGGFKLELELTRCPNYRCNSYELRVSAHHATPTQTFQDSRSGLVPILLADPSKPAGLGQVMFLPRVARPLSKHAASVVLEDYEQAYLIRTLSPKASATLARRALQGMIRDFWGVTRATLHDELAAIRDKCDPDLYNAMMSLKSVGNIGAHPEKDISLVVDVEPDEAQQLLDLLHLLDQEWYVAREARKTRLAAVQALGASKKAEQQTPP